MLDDKICIAMERKIGEIFEFDGEWYQCVEGDICTDCAFAKESCNNNPLFEAIGSCSYYRNDGASVIFKKLEKVGEPHFIEDEIFEGGKVYVQNFKVYKDFEGHEPICNDYIIYDWDKKIISIEIKQTKEDMEEKKIQHYDCFFDKKSSKSKLKPFDLDAAKAGKPVCTRDGRKARIICFDRDWDTDIVALVAGPLGEEVRYYWSNGKVDYDEEEGDDLMMLPEKKEGWVNIYALNTCYSSKEEAEANIDRDYEHEYVRTVKISWEE